MVKKMFSLAKKVRFFRIGKTNGHACGIFSKLHKISQKKQNNRDLKECVESL